MVKVGQTLWGINKETGIEETVTVVKVCPEFFVVEFKGQRGRYNFSALNSIFHTEPRKTPTVTVLRACSNCFLRHSGSCSSLSDNVCEDYRPKQSIPQNEIDNWPQYGDATAIRTKDWNHFK